MNWWKAPQPIYHSQKQKTQNRAKTPTEPTEKPTLDENDMRHLWEIPEDLGRRYAFVSGDFRINSFTSAISPRLLDSQKPLHMVCGRRPNA